jgi:pyrroline-5-carboxylate reductase
LRRPWSRRAAKRETRGVSAIWLIGCGNMAGAMLSRWLATGLDPDRVTVIDPGIPDVGVRGVATLPDEPAPDMLMLGVKPQMLGTIAPGLQATNGALLVSILAGTTTATLTAMFPGARAVLRAMPNLPVAIGKGVVGLHGTLNDADRTAINALMAPLGLVEWIADEAQFDAVTALSGSGPAFVYRFIDALAQGGAALGLPTDQAARLALATVEGAALTAAASDATPADLAERVASKGGSTRMGLDVLDANKALSELVAATLASAAARNRELATFTKTG